MLLTVAPRHGKGPAALSQPAAKVAALANPELGAKQICPTCSSKFYDLGRRPAHCPKCGADFDPEEALRNRRVRARAIVPDDDAEEEKVVAKVESEDGFEAEPDEAPELDAVVDDPPLISDDDADESDAAPSSPADDIGVDFAEDDDLEAADDDEVPFIEDEDDDFPEDEIDGLPGEGGPDDQ
jgi:uncharacterized protein (TIGR02300 family)